MKTTSINITLLILILFAAVFGLRAADTLSVDVTTTPAFRAFLTNYVTAINSKDRAKLNQYIHAKSVAILAKDQKFSDSFYGGRFTYSIPADFEVYAHAIPADKPQPLANYGAAFTPRPAYQVQIQFKPTSTNIDYMVLWVASENDKWYEVLPYATKKMLPVWLLWSCAAIVAIWLFVRIVRFIYERRKSSKSVA
jgi:hypothetical protein